MVIYQDVTSFSGKVDPATRDVKAFARFGLAQIAIEFLNVSRFSATCISAQFYPFSASVSWQIRCWYGGLGLYITGIGGLRHCQEYWSVVS